MTGGGLRAYETGRRFRATVTAVCLMRTFVHGLLN